MKRIFKLLSILLLCGALSCPSTEARGRNNGNSGSQGTSQNSPSRNNGGSNNGRPNSGNQSRPNNGGTQSRPNNGGTQSRPNEGGTSNGRPGSSVNQPNNSHSRPNSSPNQRPNNPGNNTGPGNNMGPGNPGHGNNFGPSNPGHGPNNGPGFGPGHNGGYNRPPSVGHIPQHQPYRPMLPPPSPWYRPTPPPAFRPGPRYPVISTILGVTIGTALNLSLDYLFNSGYYITGYTNDAVYLNDVIQLNMLWPNATLYYSGGRLMGSEFVYSTPYYDMSRYYDTYNALNRAYGGPVSRQTLPGGGVECSWFGYNGQYVTLQFIYATAINGISRYYTTLSFGA